MPASHLVFVGFPLPSHETPLGLGTKKIAILTPSESTPGFRMGVPCGKLCRPPFSGGKVFSHIQGLER